MHYRHSILIIGWAFLALACRTDEVIYPSQTEPLPIHYEGGSVGMYVLNQGNMGSNKASLDFVDFQKGCYIRNWYGERNPQVVKELGDVGNDLKIYGSKLYAVINCSHKVEVMNAQTGVRIGQVEVPNCRYLTFGNGKMYVSAYVGPVSMDPNAQVGAVYEVDTASLEIERQVSVGYQPEELLIQGEKLYVVNSGGYRAPEYDSTLSVVDLKSFRQIRQITVGLNPHHLRADPRGRLWITLQGNNGTVGASLVVVEQEKVINRLPVPCANLEIMGDSLFYYTTASNGLKPEYGIIDTESQTVLPAHWMPDSLAPKIKVPYAIRINPFNRDIYVTDAKNYVSSGSLYCLSKEGVLQWSARTGDIPCALCFLPD